MRQHLDTLNGAPADACEEIIAAKYVEHATAPFASQASGKVHGPTVVAETVNWLRAQFPDLQLTILAIVAGNDIVAYSATCLTRRWAPGAAVSGVGLGGLAR